MYRVKIKKDYKGYRQGQTLEVSRNEAHELIEAGVAAITKDMVSGTDYGSKVVQKGNRGGNSR